MNNISPYLIEIRREKELDGFTNPDWKETVSNWLLYSVRVYNTEKNTGKLISIFMDEKAGGVKGSEVTAGRVMRAVAPIFALLGWVIPYNWIGKWLCEKSESHTKAYETVDTNYLLLINIREGNIGDSLDRLTKKSVTTDWASFKDYSQKLIEKVSVPVNDELAEKLLQFCDLLSAKALESQEDVSLMTTELKKKLIQGEEETSKFRCVGEAFIINEDAFRPPEPPPGTAPELSRSTPIKNPQNWSLIEEEIKKATNAEEVRFCSTSGKIPIEHLRKAGTLYGRNNPDVSKLHEVQEVTFADEEKGQLHGFDIWVFRKISDLHKVPDHLTSIKKTEFESVLKMVHEDAKKAPSNANLGRLKDVGTQLGLHTHLPAAIRSWTESPNEKDDNDVKTK